jgi:ABC-type transport system involved in multi-copper enzyme maturation permease subunit
MNATIAAQMFSADLLKLRKRLGVVVISALLAWVPVLILFVVRALLHSSTPSEHLPAGGVEGFSDSLRLLALFLGPLAAVLIGVEAGVGDFSAGVFRDLVVTGRSRLALFASRIPAALVVTWVITAIGYGLVVIGSLAFAGGQPTPGGGLILEGLGFALLANGVVCGVAVGLAALMGSKPGAITTLIGWQLVASPLIASITSLGSARRAILSQAIVHFDPTRFGRVSDITLSAPTAIIVAALWLLVFVGLGAWRTSKVDA